VRCVAAGKAQTKKQLQISAVSCSMMMYDRFALVFGQSHSHAECTSVGFSEKKLNVISCICVGVHRGHWKMRTCGDADVRMFNG